MNNTVILDGKEYDLLNDQEKKEYWNKLAQKHLLNKKIANLLNENLMLFEGGSSIKALMDPEGNGDGVIACIEAKDEEKLKQINETNDPTLLGTINKVEYKDMGDILKEMLGISFETDEGFKFFIAQDDEMNGPGALIFRNENGEEINLPSL